MVHKVPVQTDRPVEAESSRQAWLITHPHPARQAGFDVFHPLLPPSLSHSSPDGSPSQPTTHRMANNRFLFLFIGSRRIGSRPEQSICRYIAALLLLLLLLLSLPPGDPHDSIRPLVLRLSSSLTSGPKRAGETHAFVSARRKFRLEFLITRIERVDLLRLFGR